VLGWLGIGCGTLLIIAILVISLMIGWCKRTVGNFSDFQTNPEKAAAEMMVRLNPDIKKVSQDDAKGEMTIRTKEGQEVTLSYKDISQGKFTIKDADGNVSQFGQADLTNVPEWVPRVPNVKNVSASLQTIEGGKTSGVYNATSSESIAGLKEFFKTEAEKLKFTESDNSSFSADGAENSTLSYESTGKKLTVILSGKPGQDTQVTVSYEQPK